MYELSPHTQPYSASGPRALLILALTGLVGCTKGNTQMVSVQELWGDIASAMSVPAETAAVEALRQYLTTEQLAFTIEVLTHDGERLELNQVEVATEIRSVNICFHLRTGDYIARDWVVRDHENIYLLLRE